MRILVVEDEPKIATLVQKGLEREGYAVDTAQDGQNALDMIETYPYDLVVLDLMLPKRDGLDVLRTIRRRDQALPVIILTARSSVDDVGAGLDSGADDYVKKPFSFRELSARIRAVLRRPGERRLPKVAVGPLVLDQASREIRLNGVPLPLTRKEYALLEYLMLKPGTTVSRDQLLAHMWDDRSFTADNALDVHMHAVRTKLGPYADLVETVRGVGYRLKGD